MWIEYKAQLGLDLLRQLYRYLNAVNSETAYWKVRYQGGTLFIQYNEQFGDNFCLIPQQIFFSNQIEGCFCLICQKNWNKEILAKQDSIYDSHKFLQHLRG